MEEQVLAEEDVATTAAEAVEAPGSHPNIPIQSPDWRSIYSTRGRQRMPRDSPKHGRSYVIGGGNCVGDHAGFNMWTMAASAA